MIKIQNHNCDWLYRCETLFRGNKRDCVSEQDSKEDTRIMGNQGWGNERRLVKNFVMSGLIIYILRRILLARTCKGSWTETTILIYVKWQMYTELSERHKLNIRLEGSCSTGVSWSMLVLEANGQKNMKFSSLLLFRIICPCNIYIYWFNLLATEFFFSNFSTPSI